MRTLLLLAVVGFVFVQTVTAAPAVTGVPAENQPGVGERVGESVERGLNKLGEKLRKTWAEFRKSVDELSVQGRVYARIHWDRTLANSPIEISVQDENVVTLSGNVPNEPAHRTAASLAGDTVGVGRVVDRLTVGATTTTTTTTTTTVPATPPLEVPKQ